MNSPDGDERARSVADTVARRSYGKLVAFLAARTRDVASAEDALSDAFVSALASWPVHGCPSNPEAWLLTAARRKLIDIARRRRHEDTANEPMQLHAEGWDEARTDVDVPDHRLALDVCLRASGDRAGHSGAVDSADIARTQCRNDRVGVSHVPGDHGPATRARQEQDQASRHSVSHTGA